MIIHVVQSGETTKSIAESYGILEERLIIENEIKNPNKLAIGETLIILYPEITYVVQEGDTLQEIAEKMDVTVLQILQNNPYLSDREYLYPGESLVIKYTDKKSAALSTNGYAYPFIDRSVLKKTLPFLTYLTVFSYEVTETGEMIDIDDNELVNMANSFGVAPIMMLTALANNQLEAIHVVHSILQSFEKQDKFINELIQMLQKKGYYGVNINTPYILPGDRSIYVDFITRFINRLSTEGFKAFITLSLSTFEILTGAMYRDLEYEKLGQLADGIILIAYEWGNAIGIPPALLPYHNIQKLIYRMIQLIPPEKLYIGGADIGFVWKLPYEESVTKGLTITYNLAIETAYEYNSEIFFDPTTISAYFQYISANEYMVRFRDARSVKAFTCLVPRFGLNGIAIWNIMMFLPHLWLVVNSQYEIDKVL